MVIGINQILPYVEKNLETFSGVMIKLPKSDTDQSLKLVLQILKDNQFRNIKLIDLRQKKQIIINE